MSTIYTFHQELPAVATAVATGDRMLVADVSTSATTPTKKDILLSVLDTAGLARGAATTDVVGFYGAIGVDQGTMTATCVTALTTNPTFSASSTGAGVMAWSSSTVATAYITRVRQMQVDLENLLTAVDSTALLAIS